MLKYIMGTSTKYIKTIVLCGVLFFFFLVAGMSIYNVQEAYQEQEEQDPRELFRLRRSRP